MCAFLSFNLCLCVMEEREVRFHAVARTLAVLECVVVNIEVCLFLSSIRINLGCDKYMFKETRWYVFHLNILGIFIL